VYYGCSRVMVSMFCVFVDIGWNRSTANEQRRHLFLSAVMTIIVQVIIRRLATPG